MISTLLRWRLLSNAIMMKLRYGLLMEEKRPSSELALDTERDVPQPAVEFMLETAVSQPSPPSTRVL
jgi:hypothetical protein